MSKIAFMSLGVAGTAGAGVGGYFLVERSKSSTIRSKYSQALLNEKSDSTLGDQKYQLIKNATPHNETLRKAVTKSKETGKEEEAKALFKQGCLEVYESNHEDTNSFSDFKNYCSRTNKDESKDGTWNTDAADKGSDNKGDKAIDALKTRNAESGGKLDPVLERLKEEASGTSPNTQNIRTQLKKGCEDTNSEVFMGRDSLKFENQESFCKVIA